MIQPVKDSDEKLNENITPLRNPVRVWQISDSKVLIDIESLAKPREPLK